MSPRLKLSLLIALLAIIYLLGNAQVALWDRDEPRNAQAARQMLQSGDWVVPRFLDQVRNAKPPLTNWCQATAMAILGDNAFAARLPSAIAMTLTLTLLAFVLSRHTDPDRTFWTVFILGTSGMVIMWSARNSLTDAVLLFWITLAQICLFAMLRGRTTWPIVLTFAAACGFAGLTKGPVVLGICGMTLLALLLCGTGDPPVSCMQERHGRVARATIKLLAALALFAAIVTPWMMLVEQRSPGFLLDSISRNVIQRIREPAEQHNGPPGYYVLVLWGIYFPWSVLLPLTFVVAWRHRAESIVRFCLAATIGPWLMLELVKTKLPHYLLPVFPPLAYLSADAIVRCLRREHDDLTTRGTRGAIVAWGVIVALLGFAPWLAYGKFDKLPIGAMVAFSILGIVYAFVVIFFFQKIRPAQGLLAMGVGMLLVTGLTMVWYLPGADFLRLAPRVAAVLNSNHATGRIEMLAYKEPSLAFYQGGTIREQSESDLLLTHPPTDWPDWLVIRDDFWLKTPDAIKAQWEVVGSERGLAYADKGRTWTVYVLRKRSS